MLRKGGSLSCYLVQGKLPRAPQPEFLEALASQRFTSIETSASEDVSVGWVTPGDPTGETFEAEDIDYDAGFWLRVRIDKKKLPTKWVTIYRSAAEKSRGRPLTRRERQELNVDLKEKLLPRVLPTVNLLDVLYYPERGRVLVFTTGKGVRDQFTSLFHSTFDGALLLPADPHHLATEGNLDAESKGYLNQVSPVRWPREGEPNTPRALPMPAQREDFDDEDLDDRNLDAGPFHDADEAASETAAAPAAPDQDGQQGLEIEAGGEA